jgi:hypothetical protein
MMRTSGGSELDEKERELAVEDAVGRASVVGVPGSSVERVEDWKRTSDESGDEMREETRASWRGGVVASADSSCAIGESSRTSLYCQQRELIRRRGSSSSCRCPPPEPTLNYN